MIQSYQANTPVTLSIPLDGVKAQFAHFTLMDEKGYRVIANVDVPVTFDDVAIKLVIGEEFNRLVRQERKALRIVALTVEDVDGFTHQFNERYAVIASSALEVPCESLLTVNESILVLMDIPNLDAYESCDEFERRRALIEASRRICTLPFALGNISRQFSDFNWEESTGRRLRLNEISATQFRALPDFFLRDLRIATVVEANEVAGGNPIENARRSGILSESVGETTNMYQSGRPVQDVIGSDAYRILSRYIERRFTVAR